MAPTVHFKAPALGTKGLGENILHWKSTTTKPLSVWWKKQAKHPESLTVGGFILISLINLQNEGFF